MTPGERAAERLLRDKDELARTITDALYRDLPQLAAKYGERGREKCRQDMCYNLEHLAPAVALDDASLFAAYVRWLVGLLAARHIPVGEVARSLALTGVAVSERFPEDERRPALAALQAGLDVMG